VERRTQRDSAITSALALWQLFYVEGEVLEKVESFWYLRRILAQDDDDIRAVRSQLKKAWGIWAQVGQVLQVDNTPLKVSAKFYKAVVQSVLLYVKKYAHVELWTRDRTSGVKSIFCAPAGRAKGNVSSDFASRSATALPKHATPFPLPFFR